MLERVDALATVHRKLYQSDDITQFDVGALAETLLRDVVASTGRTNITVVANVEEINVPSSHASALGLVINELLTNAMKHAYGDGRGGVLTVTANSDGHLAVIAVEDDGPGMPLGNVQRQGLGLTLINRLSRQVDANTEWRPCEPGTRVTITFPLQAQTL